jgi:hypothetical protein
VQLPLARHDVDRDQEGLIQLAAVDGDRVNLPLGVGARHVAARRVARSANAHADDSLRVVKRAPLALHSEQASPGAEDKVTATVFRHGLENFNAELHRFEGDRGFGDIALFVRRQHPARLAPIG